jgi:arylsulfatase A-like enzyme
MKRYAALMVCLLALGSGCRNYPDQPRPNVILIMADDMGYECLGSNGSFSYKTPVLDELAATGLRFTNCYAQPLCTPSRVKIMTGLRNYRNYEYFGYLNENQLTFGTVMKEAGYSTCIAGKWQLNGLSYNLPGYEDHARPHLFGFEEYCLWQLTVPGNKGGRYANPVIEQNGKILENTANDYGPDIFADFVIDFIEKHDRDPFFIYYPMVLVHNPFVPTPDSSEWDDPGRRLEKDTKYFSDMVSYTDKTVGRIIGVLKEKKLFDNTIVIFTGDNGTNRAITSETTWGTVQGFKGNMTDAGTRVPLLISWPEGGNSASVYQGLVDFADFMPTFSEIAGRESPSDGRSLLPLLKGDELTDKEQIFIHYDPRWGVNVNKYRNQFARSLEYKLYQDGKFYYLPDDVLEMNPLDDDVLNGEQQRIRKSLRDLIDEAPVWIDD